MDYFDRITEAADFLRARVGETPGVAVVLGSGLGDFADGLEGAVSLPYTDIPHWPASRIVGHAGRLVVGNVAGKRVVALAGRVHFY
jgi:purine-nucleoside phosphorylase